jgi:hypothetical protein
MVIDRYTKIVLTVIAVMLTLIVVRDFAPAAVAQVNTPVHVILDKVEFYAFNQMAPMPVKVEH